MLLCTIFLLTPWQWAIVALVIYIIGTEIRVRAEDKLLAGRFGEEFERLPESPSRPICRSCDSGLNMRRVCLSLLAAAAVCAWLRTVPTSPTQYRSVADRLIDAALADNEGYNRLAYLCYRIGNRLSGSTGLEKAVAWSAEQMKAAGLSNVRIIPVKVPHWVRGAESARMLTPLDKPLHMLGLGGSIATPPGGITADVVAVSDFNELAKLGKEKIQGKDRGLQRAVCRVWTDSGVPVVRRISCRRVRRSGIAGALGDTAGDADSPYRRNELRRGPA